MLKCCDLPGHGGDVLSHTAELANNLLHAFLAAQDGRVHVLDTLGKVVHWVRLCKKMNDWLDTRI